MIDEKINLIVNNLEKIEDIISQLKVLDNNDRYQRIFKATGEEQSLISAALWLLLLREKASEKFPLAEHMFFNTLGLEQSSSEKVSSYIASRFPSSWRILDLNCGIGGNLLSLAKNCQEVIANDISEQILEVAKLNAKAGGVEDKVEFLCLEANSLISLIKKKEILKDKKIEAIFLDPDRSREGKTKTRSLKNSQPNLFAVIDDLFSITNNIAVKISPAFDYKEVALLPGDPEIEIISENNNCKVAMLWFGDLKKNRRSAVGFRKEKQFIFTGEGLENYDLVTERPKKYIYEPDKALSKAGLVSDLAEKYSLNRVSHSSSFLTSNINISDLKEESDRDFFSAAISVYRTVKVFDLSFKELKKELKKMAINKVEIKTRDHFLKADEIYKKLGLQEGSGYCLLFIPLKDFPKRAILMEKCRDCNKY